MPIDREALWGKIFKPKELAEVLGVTQDSIRRVIREGKLKAVCAFGGSRLFIHGEDVIRYLEGLGPSGESAATRPKRRGRPPARLKHLLPGGEKEG